MDVEWEENKHPRDEGGKFTSGGGTSGGKVIEVEGPKGTRVFIKGYLSAHPDVKKEIPKYRGVLDKVKNFEKEHPGAEDGTYDPFTGEIKDQKDGYSVTFHQNLAVGDEFGGYDDDDYAAMCAIAAKELGADGANIGFFGNPEVSFNCKDRDTARKFARAHNQHSVYDVANNDLWINPDYDKKLNPIKGK